MRKIDPKVRDKVEELLRVWPQNRVRRNLRAIQPDLTDEDLPSLRTISRIAVKLKAAGKPHRGRTQADLHQAALVRRTRERENLEHAAAAYRAGQTPRPGEKRATYAAIARQFRVKIPTLVRWCRKLECRKKDAARERGRAAKEGGVLVPVGHKAE